MAPHRCTVCIPDCREYYTENLRNFYQSVVDVYGTEYLRFPNEDDVVRIREMHESK